MESVERFSLGKYTLVAELARGGMGVIYLAQVQGPGGFKKSVVVKELKPELAEDPKFREMFLEEANLAARLNHRNIVQTNEVGEDESRLFMTMDYLEGRSLYAVQKRLRDEQKLPVTLKLRVISEVLAGLHYAHELTDYNGTPLRIVHRDVGPQNIFLTYDGQVKLLDFGVAKMANRRQETQTGVLKGRVAYMAPEQVSGEPVDRRVDIFAMGVLMRELITGQRLWKGVGEIDILRRILARDVAPFPCDVDVASELREVCERAMALNRHERFESAHEMRVLIDAHLLRVDPTGSLADLGTHLAREFQAERKRVKDVVDSYLAVDGDASLPQMDFLVQSSTSGSLGDSGSSLRRRPAKTPASGTVVSGEPPEVEVNVAAPARVAPVPWRWAAMGGAGAAVIMALFLGLRGRLHEEKLVETPLALSSSSTGISPATSLADERPNTIEVSVRVTPEGAHIFIDGVPAPGSPYRASFVKDVVATHSIRAVAAGFVSKTELVKFDSNVSVSLSLERQALAPVVRPPEPRVVVQSPPPSKDLASVAATAKVGPTESSPRAGKAPKREIDPKNPYGAE